MSAKKTGAKYGILLLLGSLLGALATLFVSTDKDGKMKASVRTKVKRLKGFANDLKEQERLQDIFGKVTEEGKRFYREARSELVKELAALKESLDEIDKTKYSQVVTSVIDRLKSEGKTTSKELSKIKTYLLEDYQKMKKQTKDAA